jgi:hypothetical protein
VTGSDQTPIAHDVPRRSDFVRNPLSVIDAFIDLALEGDPSQDPASVAERAGVSRAADGVDAAALIDLSPNLLAGTPTTPEGDPS